MDDEDEDEDSDEEVDDEAESDSDFQSKLDQIANYSDIDQSMKGEDINLIGQIDGLGKKRKDELKLVGNYEAPKVNDMGIEEQPKAKQNKFFAKQQADRVKAEN